MERNPRITKKYNCIRFHLIFAYVSSKKRYPCLLSLNTHFSLQKCMSTTLFTVVPQRQFSKYKMKTINFGVYCFSGESRPAFSRNTQRIAIAASQIVDCVFGRQTSLTLSNPRDHLRLQYDVSREQPPLLSVRFSSMFVSIPTFLTILVYL